MSDPPFRILPRLDDATREFWTGGAQGELRFWRCQDCGYYIHPPLPICPIDHSKNLAVEAVSGRATLATYSVNHQNWMPGPELPVCGRDHRDRRATVGAPHDQPRELPARRDPDRHAPARHVRASSRSRRRRVPPTVRTRRSVMDANDIIERRACITGVGQSEIGRRLNRDPLELTLDGCLAAIADAGLTTADIDGISTYPGPMAQPAGFSGAGAYEVMDALRLQLRLVRQRHRDVGPARLGDQRVPRGGVGTRQPRALLPFRLRGIGPGRQGPGRRDARWRRGRRRRSQDVGVHVVEPRVLRAVGRDLDRDVRPEATSTSTARRASSSRGSR